MKPEQLRVQYKRVPFRSLQAFRYKCKIMSPDYLLIVHYSFFGREVNWCFKLPFTDCLEFIKKFIIKFLICWNYESRQIKFQTASLEVLRISTRRIYDTDYEIICFIGICLQIIFMSIPPFCIFPNSSFKVNLTVHFFLSKNCMQLPRRMPINFTRWLQEGNRNHIKSYKELANSCYSTYFLQTGLIQTNPFPYIQCILPRGRSISIIVLKLNLLFHSLSLHNEMFILTFVSLHIVDEQILSRNFL